MREKITLLWLNVKNDLPRKYVRQQNYMDLRNNIDESLLMKLKEYYRQPVFFKTPLVEISEE